MAEKRAKVRGYHNPKRGAWEENPPPCHQEKITGRKAKLTCIGEGGTVTKKTSKQGGGVGGPTSRL